jgi:hypothetical protein
MPALVAGIHAATFSALRLHAPQSSRVDGRDKPGHDALRLLRSSQ